MGVLTTTLVQRDAGGLEMHPAQSTEAIRDVNLGSAVATAISGFARGKGYVQAMSLIDAEVVNGDAADLPSQDDLSVASKVGIGSSKERRDRDAYSGNLHG